MNATARTRITLVVVALLAWVGRAEDAAAYVGPSFLQVPGVPGDWHGQQHKDWFRALSHYWTAGPMIQQGLNRDGIYLFRPAAPRQGPSSLVIAVEKKDPALSQLMELCTNKTVIPELSYAESSDIGRSINDFGARPKQVPDYYEYKLKDVRFSDCPVVADASEQAIVISFDSIEWLNFNNKEQGVAPEFPISTLTPKPSSRTTKSFLVTWLGFAHDVSSDQCPVLGKPPTEDDYYALVPKEEADKERIALASKGGVNYGNGQMGLRGPHRLNVCKVPGIVRDPGNPTPQTTIARGFDLDGNDGTGESSAGTCRHKNFVSADGRTGIDNQLYSALGCIPGLQGHKGWQQQFSNNQMRDGALSILLQITGLDNMRNDDNVDVTFFYSLDPMTKSATGTQVLSDYTFRVSDDPHYTHYFRRFHGRMVNGVLTTEPVKDFRIYMGKLGLPSERRFADARMRLEFTPDGNIKGIVGGYMDLWWISNQFGASAGEEQIGYTCPGVYNALRRAADGLKDPVTGECNGISAVYDVEGIPAFIMPAHTKVARADSDR